MRSLSLLFAPSLLLLAASAGAQNLPYPPSSPEPMSTVQVTASPKAVWVRPDVARQISGAYEMSNGWHMRVRTSAYHVDATIDAQRPIRLTAVARNRFVSSDGNVSMVFNQGDSGDQVTMRYRPDPRLAQVIVLSSRLAQR
jgi:hypothetical protein